MTPIDLAASWRARAEQLRPYAPAAAEAFERAAAELEGALREAADEELTLAEAAVESGYSERRIRELLADGDVPMAPGGRKGRPRIRRADLPRRPGGAGQGSVGGYDPDADAAALLSRGAL
jgi:hypothetical protein